MKCFSCFGSNKVQASIGLVHFLSFVDSVFVFCVRRQIYLSQLENWMRAGVEREESGQTERDGHTAVWRMLKRNY